MEPDGPAHRAHLARIAGIVRRFTDGDISGAEKRRLIDLENRAVYGQDLGGVKKQRRRMLGNYTPADAIETVLADRHDLPVEAVEAALGAAREANRWAAEHAVSLAQEREVIRHGQELRNELLYGAGQLEQGDGGAAAGMAEAG